MKKISLLVLICMILSLVFASCDMILPQTSDEDPHEHSYSTDWSFDAANHYHACSCGSQSDVAAHADGNNDGACDTCAIILSNVHTFAGEWTTDAANHWHASLCGHDVVDAKAAHTANDLGFCTVCGVKVSAPAIETVADAIEIALAQDYAAKAGSVFYTYDQYDEEWDEYVTVNSLSYFDKSEGYLHVTNLTESTETWYYAIGDDSVWSVVSESGAIGYNDEEYSVDNLNGYYFNGAIMGYSSAAQAYGVADLIDALYFLGENSVIPVESEVISTDEGTVYYYTFGAVTYGYVRFVEVYFTLDQSGYYIDNAFVAVATVEEDNGVTIEYEKDENGDYVYDDNWDLVVKSVTLDEGVALEYSASYEITQGEALTAPVSPDDLVIPSFAITDGEGKAIGDTVEMTLGSPIYLYVAPNGGSLSYDPLTITVLDADGYETRSCNAWSWNEGEIYVSATQEGEYTVTVATVAYSVSFKVVASAPAVETFEVGVYSESTYSYDAASTHTVNVNKSFNFKALVNSYANDGYTWTVVGEEGTYTVANVWGTVYSFTATEAGTYTLTLTSDENADITATLVITVVEGEVKTVESVLNGDYIATFYGTTLYEVTFTPQYDGATYGDLTVVDKNGNSLTGEYKYGYNDDGTIEIMDSDWYPISTITITMDEDLNLTFNTNFAMERPEAEEDVDPIDKLVDQTYTDGTYYLTFTKTEADDEVKYTASLKDVAMGKPTSVGISFTSYTLTGPDATWGDYELTLVVAEDGNLGTNPLDAYTVAYVNADFDEIAFVNYDTGDTVTYYLYNPYA